jgi:hypothetical protein
MEATFAEEYSAIHKGLLHYMGLISFHLVFQNNWILC